MRFCDQLNEYIAALGCSAQELCAAANISPAALSRYRGGSRIPDLHGEPFARLCEAIAAQSQSMTAEDVRVLIRETCVAEHVHFMLCVVFLFVSRFWEDNTWIFFWGIYAVCNLPFIIIQRYNRPMLVRLLRRMEARESRLAASRGDDAVTEP